MPTRAITENKRFRSYVLLDLREFNQILREHAIAKRLGRLRVFSMQSVGIPTKNSQG